MVPPLLVAELVLSFLTLAGIAQCAAGVRSVRRFARQPYRVPALRPKVTVLKPLHGVEPLLEQALETFFTQNYPDYQLVFGVQSPTDPAIGVVRSLRHRYPERDVALVIDTASHGCNQKISNLINMMASAKHDVLVLADSDVHAASDYLDRLIATLDLPGTGIATTLYSGLPARRGPVPALGASHISHTFLPGALMARALGRQDCLGATMAMRRATLDRIGGFRALADQLADDAMLGRLTQLQGLQVRLAPTVPATTVPELTLHELIQHEMRWARTIRSLAPLGHALSMIQFPIAWALAVMVVTGGAWWSVSLFGAAWGARALAQAILTRSMGLPTLLPIALLPVRDVLSVSEVLASYRGGRVRWRGRDIPIGKPLDDLRAQANAAYRAAEPVLGQG
jgi:ceramide glucosyltransferase